MTKPYIIFEIVHEISNMVFYDKPYIINATMYLTW